MKSQLVDHLVNCGLVSRKNVQRCLLRANMGGRSVVDEMAERLEIDQQGLASEMAKFWGFKYWEESKLDVASSRLEAISSSEAEEYGAIPIEVGEEDVIGVAVYDVEMARPIIDKIRSDSGVPPTVVVAPRDVIQREVERHYGDDGKSQANGSTPGAAKVLRKRPRRRNRPAKVARSAMETPVAGVTPVPDPISDDAQPTRQIDLAADNPFMDLVKQTADEADEQTAADEAIKRQAPTVEGPSPYDKQQQKQADKPEAEVEDEFDFFDDFGDGDDIEALVEESWSDAVEEVEIGSPAEEESIDPIDEALDEFDAALDADVDAELDEESSPLSSSASVNWGEYDHEPDPGAPLAGAAPPSGRTGKEFERVRSKSGIFPVGKDDSGIFDLPDERDEGEVTLSQVVKRQRNLIEKLEREISYQKAILQTMTEMLVEAKVLSKKKVKSRLRALKEEQRKRYEEE